MPDQEISQDKIELVGAFRECGAILAAIGDENRQRILTALIEKPGLRVEEIREYTDLSRPAVSHHLKILKDAEAISVLKLGTKNYYFPGCESDIWRKLNALTGEICSLAEKIRDNELDKRRMEIVNERYD